jgi:hypothetical protein
MYALMALDQALRQGYRLGQQSSPPSSSLNSGQGEDSAREKVAKEVEQLIDIHHLQTEDLVNQIKSLTEREQVLIEALKRIHGTKDSSCPECYSDNITLELVDNPFRPVEKCGKCGLQF